jgi:glycosyltransferase involved in cell wall biosynthesis
VPAPEAPSLAQRSGEAGSYRSLWLLDHAPIMGGAEQFALRLAGHARLEGGYRVCMVCPAGSGLAQRSAAAGLEVVDAEFPDLAPWFLARQLQAVARTRKLLIEAGQLAIVVAVSARAQAYTVAAATLLRHPPAIVHVALEQDTARRLTARFALPRQGAVIAVGANAAAAYRVALPSTEVDQVNNFLMPEEMARLRAGPRSSHAGLAIGLIARMIPEKGVLELLDELAASGSDGATLLVAGPAEDQDYEREVRARVSALGLDGRVRLMGRIDDIRSLLKAVDVVAVPSTGWEGQPTVILEALAAGVAVVVRRPLDSSDFEGLPVFGYTDATDFGAALEAAAASSPAPMEALLDRFGPDQALGELERAAARLRRR